jgi:hypothetical protein
MKRLILVLFPFFVSCAQKPDNSEAELKKSASLEAHDQKNNSVDSNRKTNLEYLEFDSVRINLKLPLLCKAKDLLELLGKADSLVTPNRDDICVTYFDKDIQLLYFGKSQFEIEGDSAVISSLHFKNNSQIKLNIGSLILDCTLTLTKLTTLFPNSVQLKEEVTIENGEKAIIVQLACSKNISDFFWTLFFHDGKLIRIDFGMTC